MTITLKKYNSKFFPVLATWKIGSGEYSAAFANPEEAAAYLIGRFGHVDIINKI